MHSRRSRAAIPGGSKLWITSSIRSASSSGVRRPLVAALAPLSPLLLQKLVQRPDDLLERARQIALVVDVADDLLAQQQLARREPQQRQLVVQVVVQSRVSTETGS